MKRAAIGLAKIALLATGALFAANALALDPSRQPSQYAIRHWQTEDGLPQNSVQAIAQTPDGYLWLGTQSGLVRFDGVRFTVFDPEVLPEVMLSPFITSLHVRM